MGATFTLELSVQAVHRAVASRLLLAVTLAAAACARGTEKPLSAEGSATGAGPSGTSDDGGSGDGGDAGDEGASPPADASLTTEQIEFYLDRIAPKIASRSLSYGERELIRLTGEEAIARIVEGWTAEPGFAEAVRFMIEDQLHTSGARDGVDFSLPGNLAAEIALESLPWSTILTADYCVDSAGQHIACDTGAPYESGVLATRAYMIGNKGRFNLGRAKRMLETFACRIYPMESEIQIPLPKPVLIPMFRAETPEEQTVEEAAGGFGNGLACYHCHSQFGAHAQLYVRFDDTGLWREDATGLQDPAGEMGRSTNGLYTSHMNDPGAAQSENSQVFGVDVENLRGAADVISASPLFQECTIKNIIARAFALPSGASDSIDAELLGELARQLTQGTADPPITAYYRTIFTDRQVIDAVLATMEASP